jgi:hypothetical protein
MDAWEASRKQSEDAELPVGHGTAFMSLPKFRAGVQGIFGALRLSVR